MGCFPSCTPCVCIICDGCLSRFGAWRGHRSVFVSKANELVWTARGLIKCLVNRKAVSVSLECWAWEHWKITPSLFSEVLWVARIPLRRRYRRYRVRRMLSLPFKTIQSVMDSLDTSLWAETEQFKAFKGSIQISGIPKLLEEFE